MTVTQIPTITYKEFQDDVKKNLEDLEDKIREGIDYVLEKWRTCNGNSWVKDVSPAVAALAEYYWRKLKKAIDAIWDHFEKVVRAVWRQVKRLLAHPAGLMFLSNAYSRAAGSLRDEKIEIDRMTRHVRKGWFGDAYFSYEGLANEQKAALTAVDKALTDASTKCAESAKQMLDAWSSSIEAILNVADKVFGAIKDGTDAGQWPTLDVGPAIKVIGQTGTEVLKFVNKLSTFLAENNTVNVAAWRNLNNGIEGFKADNKWPDIDSADSADVKDKDAWAHQ